MTMTLSGDGTITGLVAGGLPDSTVTADDLAAGAALNNAPNSVGFRNRIINGDMRIDQRNAGASVAVTTTGQYTVDRFRADINSSGTGRFSVQQSSTAPTGFVNSLQVTVTTADAAPTANFGYSVQQLIEGTNISDLALGTANAQPLTLSFWVRSSVTGTFPVTFLNENATRAFGAQYTISSANTWELKSIPVSGLTDGTWLTTTGLGIRVVFGLGGGTSRTMSPGYQTISGLVQTNVTGSTQLIATNGATFYLTGVQLEVGSVATPFERRPYGTELILCQRYYFRLSNTGDATSLPFGLAFTRSSNECRPFINFPVQMRVRPTGVETSGTANHYKVFYAGDNDAACTSVPSFDVSSRETALLGAVVGGTPFPSGGVCYLRSASTSAYLGFSAEL